MLRGGASTAGAGGGGTVTLTGDVTGSGTSSIATTIAASGATAGTYTNPTLTINAKGQITLAVNGPGGGTTIPVDFKDACACATTANITLSGEQTIDGFLTSASRVLVKNQTIASQNGPYVSGSGAWIRSTDADTSAEVTAGMLTFVENGTVNGPAAGSGVFVLTTADPITLDTTALSFTEIAIFPIGSIGKTVSGTTYTTILSDSGKRLNLTNAATKTITVAPQSSVNAAVNTQIEVFNAGAGLATLAPGSGVTLNSPGGVLTVPQFSLALLKKRANPNTWDVDIVTAPGTQNANLVFAGPSSGGAANPTFRALVAADINGLQGTGITAGDVGFRNIPINSHSANYTAVAADSGNCLEHPAADANARTFTIDSVANVGWIGGTALSFLNETSQVLSIAVTTETLTLAGSTTTGTRSLAQNGIATAVLNAARTNWLISGTGLT